MDPSFGPIVTGLCARLDHVLHALLYTVHTLFACQNRNGGTTTLRWKDEVMLQ
jgi:hypothetical protein